MLPSAVAALARRPTTLLALYGVAFLFRAAQNVAQTSLAPLGEADLHLRAAVLGGVIALSGGMSVAATVLLGRMAVARTVRRWMAVGLAVTAASFPVLASARSLGVLVAGACLLGAGGGLTMPSLSTLVGQHPGASAPRRLAGLAVALSVSLTLGPLADSALLHASGNSLPLTLLAFAALPALGIAVLPASRRRPGPAPPEPGIAGGGRPATAAAAAPAERAPLATSPWRRPGWRLATVAQLLYQVPFVAVISFGVIAAERLYGLHPDGAQLGISVFFVVSLATRVALTAGFELRRPKAAVGAIAALTVLGVGLLALGGSVPVLFVALAILGVPHGLVFPLALGLIAEETPPAELARANAAFSAWTSGVTVVLPAVLGGLVAVAGLRAMFLALLVPVLALGALVAAWPAPGHPVLAGGTGDARQVTERPC
ncbi:MAG TPA: MFS transporter [Acidimicrobiales bacterium]|nr:MFS transporter [Acidimicrobiales bacterium]